MIVPTVKKIQNDRPRSKENQFDSLYLAFETMLRFLETTNIAYSKLRSQGFILRGQQIICFQFAACLITQQNTRQDEHLTAT